MSQDVEFSYQSRQTPVPRVTIIVSWIVGIALFIGCGIWTAVPFVIQATGTTTSATVVSYKNQYGLTTGGTLSYRPVLKYTVDGKSYTVTSSLTVNRPDAEQHPVGSHVTVSYDPNQPSTAEWQPEGSDVAVNKWSTAGFVVGLTLIIVAAIYSRRRKSQAEPETGTEEPE